LSPVGLSGAQLFRHLRRTASRIDLFAVLAGYLDESGENNESRLLCVAISVATPDQWDAFESEWRPRLDGIDDLRGYHIKDHPSLKGHLASAVRDHTLRSWSVSVEKQVYKRCVSNAAGGAIGGAYYFLALCCFGFASDWSKRSGLGPIAFFPEQGHKGFAHLSARLNMLAASPWAKPKYDFDRWAPATKFDLPTHAPDLISHQVTSWDGDTNRDPVLSALERRRYRHSHFEEKELREIVKQVMEFHRRLKSTSRNAWRTIKRTKKRET
jgi:hypothetical protein